MRFRNERFNLAEKQQHSAPQRWLQPQIMKNINLMSCGFVSSTLTQIMDRIISCKQRKSDSGSKERL